MPYTELENGDLLVIKAVGNLPDPETDGSTITAVVSTENVDGDGDIIRQGKNKKGAGWVLDHFNKIPLLLWQHDRMTPNLSGPNTAAKVTKWPDLGKVLLLDPVEFDDGDMFAEHIKGKVERKVIRESSVGFRGLVSEVIRGSEHQYLGREFFEQKLIEVSFANRGSNLDTDTAMKSLLGRSTHALEAQGGADAAIAELKEELGDTNQQLADALSAIKLLGDSITSCDARIDVVSKVSNQSARRVELIKELHGALKQVGSAT
jgi:hypothetical protein